MVTKNAMMPRMKKWVPSVRISSIAASTMISGLALALERVSSNKIDDFVIIDKRYYDHLGPIIKELHTLLSAESIINNDGFTSLPLDDQKNITDTWQVKLNSLLERMRIFVEIVNQ